MEARYLRVKNWREYQHYSDRRPPWIKLLRQLIDGDSGREFREELSEAEQWQLVRLWLYSSGSETVMLDEKGREVPLIAYDERTLRIGIRTLKKIPLERFIRDGWLEVVGEDEIAASFVPFHDPEVASTVASALASTAASAAASTGPPKQGAVTPPEKGEGAEGAEVLSLGSFSFGAMDQLVAYCRDGDENTPRTIRSYADKLPEAAFAQALSQLKRRKPRNKAMYAVKTLSRMVEEGQYAA